MTKFTLIDTNRIRRAAENLKARAYHDTVLAQWMLGEAHHIQRQVAEQWK